MRLGLKIIVCVSLLCCLCHDAQALSQSAWSDALTFIKKVDEKIKAALGTDTAIKLSLKQILASIPVLGSVKLPSWAETWKEKIEFQVPRVTITGDSYELVCDNALVAGVETKLSLRLYAGPGKDGSEGGVSLSVGIPGKNTIDQLLPDIKQGMLKLDQKMLPENVRAALEKAHLGMRDFAKIVEWIELEDLVLIVSTKFIDPVWSDLSVGLNTTATMRFLGPLEKLLALFGSELTTVRVTGYVSPDLTGSELRGILPGKFTVLRWPPNKNKPSLCELRTGGVQFRIGLSANGLLTLKAIASVDAKLPYQQDFITMNGSFNVLPVSATGPALELEAWMNGMVYNLFGIPGVDMGNFGFGIAFSLASVAAEGMPTALSGKGEVHIGPMTSDGLVSIDLNSGQVGLITHAGEFSSTDIVDYVVHVMEAGAKLIKKPLDMTTLKPLLYKALPPFTLHEVTFYFVPVEAEIFDVWYSPGIHIKGGVELFGVGGQAELGLLMYSGLIPSFKGLIQLKEIKIPRTDNPAVIISGAGKDMKRGTADDGPIFTAELSPERQVSYLDGYLKIPSLGIESDSRFLSTAAGMECDLKNKLGGLFDAEFHITTNISSLESWKIQGFVNQQGLGVLGNALQDEAKKFSKKAQDDLATAKSNVLVWQQQAEKDIDVWVADQVAKTDKVINQLTAMIENAQAKCAKSNALNWIIECAQMTLIPGYTLNLGLAYVHREVTIKGVAREVAKSGVRLASGYAHLGLGVAQGAVEFARATTDFMGKLLAGGLNITSVTINGSLKELTDSGVLPRVEVAGILLGKSFKQVYQVDFRQPNQLLDQILAGLLQVFGPQPQPYQAPA